MPASDPPVPRGDLSVTALYTCGAWAWSDRPGAALYASEASRRVFGTVEAVLRIARWFVRDAPSLRHGLVQRHLLIDAAVREHGAAEVLELAAGLSPRGAAFTASHDGPRWIEVDLPPVVSYKTALLHRTDAGRAVLARPTLSRVAADVTATDLRTLLDPAGPATVVAEGLLMYLDAAAQRALFRRIADLLTPHGGRFTFDLVPPAEQPPPGWIARTLGAWMKRFTGGQGIVASARTRDDLVRDLRSAGFHTVQLVEPSAPPAGWDVPHLDIRTQQLVFVADREPAR